MRDGLGCLWIPILVIAFWGTVAYLFLHPPGLEDIPWYLAGVSISVILRAYKTERKN